MLVLRAVFLPFFPTQISLPYVGSGCLLVSSVGLRSGLSTLAPLASFAIRVVRLLPIVSRGCSPATRLCLPLVYRPSAILVASSVIDLALAIAS